MIYFFLSSFDHQAKNLRKNQSNSSVVQIKNFNISNEFYLNLSLVRAKQINKVKKVTNKQIEESKRKKNQQKFQEQSKRNFDVIIDKL